MGNGLPIATLASSVIVLTTVSAEAVWCLTTRFEGTICRFNSEAQCRASATTRSDHCYELPSTKPAVPQPRAKSEAGPAKQIAPSTTVIQPAPAKTNLPAAKTLDLRRFAEARKLVLDGQYEAGLAAMRALGFDEHPDVASFTGLAYRKLGKNDEARAWYDRALAANPRHLQTLAYSGVLRAELGDVAGARKDLERIRAICGNTTCNEYVGLNSVIAGKR